MIPRISINLNLETRILTPKKLGSMSSCIRVKDTIKTRYGKGSSFLYEIQRQSICTLRLSKPNGIVWKIA